jgi:hypothetical protein
MELITAKSIAFVQFGQHIHSRKNGLSSHIAETKDHTGSSLLTNKREACRTSWSNKSEA